MADTNLKKAQKIVNQVDGELGIALVAYTNSELEYLRNQLNKFLDLEVETDDLHDADDDDLLDDVDDEDELSDDAPYDDEEDDLEF